MKRFIFLIAFFFSVVSFFHLEILGAAIRYALKRGTGAELSFSSLYWSRGALAANDLVLRHKCGQAEIPTVSFTFKWSLMPSKWGGHLQIERPHLLIEQIPAWDPAKGNFELTLSVEEGRFDWGGAVQFSLHKDEAGSDLTLNWSDSGLRIVENEGKIEAELNQFQAHLLQSLIPFGKIDEGRISGRVSLSEEKELVSSNLRVEKFSGSVGDGALREGDGELSYHASLGAKWEMKGIGAVRMKEFPFSFSGKGFFNSRWVDSEIRLEDGVCLVARDEDWRLECKNLQAEHVSWIQNGLAPYFPQIGEWSISSGIVSGAATFSERDWTIQLDGRDLLLSKENFSFASSRIGGEFTQEGGSLKVESTDLDLKLAGKWDQWRGEARLGVCSLLFSGGWDGEKCPIEIDQGLIRDLQFGGSGWIDPHLDLSFNLKGKWVVGTKELPFYCPIFSKEGDSWAFDFRLERTSWDLLRIHGTYNGADLAYGKLSHFLGAPLQFAPTSFGELDIGVQLSRSQILSLGAVVKEWGLELSALPVLDDTALRFGYKNGEAALWAKGKLFQFEAKQEKGGWNVSLESDLSLRAFVTKEGGARGEAGWKKGSFVEFDGKIDPALKCEFALSKIQFDLGLIGDPRFEGKLEGEGHVVYDGALQADFDLNATALKLYSHGVENEGKIHFCYSSGKGALFKGVNLHGPFDCLVDLLEYDQVSSHWIFKGAQVHLPGAFLKGKYFQLLDLERDLNFKADLDFSSDLSVISCSMAQGIVPFNGADRLIENLHLVWDRGECKASLHYLNHFYQLQFHSDEGISGRLIMGEEETPLTIDWDYKNELAIHSVEGSFSGFEASFHEERPNLLIGSARINFSEFSTLLPTLVEKGFKEVKMGKGFEVKGRVKMLHNLPYFEGILCGKQIELFGFQFRTLLGQLEYSLDRVRIFNTKISDTAGMMKVDQIVMESIDQGPWTISIPTITVQELRPSLLQRTGAGPGQISPLVIREMKLTDFRGFLADETTYAAEGSLHFINSYKRGETVFDAPANVLSRIVGLDLELLIPVCGDLIFHLADRRFTLSELKNSYSEGTRSQFFLEMNPPPYMDLDWNLEIFIKMKQFVLLKFTESFLISIEGKLQDPKYHLQKRRFFGLL